MGISEVRRPSATSSVTSNLSLKSTSRPLSRKVALSSMKVRPPSRTVLLPSERMPNAEFAREDVRVALDSARTRRPRKPVPRGPSRTILTGESDLVGVTSLLTTWGLFRGSSRRGGMFTPIRVGSRGFEPPTPGLRVRCSDQAELRARIKPRKTVKVITAPKK